MDLTRPSSDDGENEGEVMMGIVNDTNNVANPSTKRERD